MRALLCVCFFACMRCSPLRQACALARAAPAAFAVNLTRPRARAHCLLGLQKMYSVMQATVVDGREIPAGVVEPATWEQGRPVPGGLSDPRMGTVDRGAKCKTCEGDRETCPGHFGHIEVQSHCSSACTDLRACRQHARWQRGADVCRPAACAAGTARVPHWLCGHGVQGVAVCVLLLLAPAHRRGPLRRAPHRGMPGLPHSPITARLALPQADAQFRRTKHLRPSQRLDAVLRICRSRRCRASSAGDGALGTADCGKKQPKFSRQGYRIFVEVSADEADVAGTTDPKRPLSAQQARPGARAPSLRAAPATDARHA